MTDALGSIAALPNVLALQTMVDKVLNRHPDLPGMATFYGRSGDGKSMAGTYVANRFDAVLVECKSLWTKKEVLGSILREMGHEPKGTLNDMAWTIANTLIVEDRVLIVDEADILVKKNCVELLRDIYEMSKAPVILIGEERLPTDLTRWERIHNRMLHWVGAQPATLDDLMVLAGLYVPKAEIEHDLAKRILVESGYGFRRICTNLNMVAEIAAVTAQERITLADWGNRAFYTGTPPDPRSSAALFAKGAL